MTKKAMAFYEGYKRSNAEHLSDVYGKYSARKARAERSCREKCDSMNGHGFRIISYNSHQFTCGWLTIENGNQFLNVETAVNSYRFAI